MSEIKVTEAEIMTLFFLFAIRSTNVFQWEHVIGKSILHVRNPFL